MADFKISLLPAGSDASGPEVLPAVQDGQTVGLTVAQLLKALLAHTSAEGIGYQLSGYAAFGALARNVAARLGDEISALDFAQGDGATDDTALLNALIAHVPDWTTINGHGKTYLVRTLALRNRLQLRNFNLIVKAGTVDGVSAILIDGTTTPKSDIVLAHININGNRASQTNINDAGAENGARHGIRMLGRCSRVNLNQVNAAFCAGDGLEMYSNGATADCFQDIDVSDSSFTDNRRHGHSIDSAKGVHFLRADFMRNGLDLNTSDALSVGTRGSRIGATLAGHLYGNGGDIEGYGNYSTCRDITYVQCLGLGNARGGLLFLANSTTYADPDFVPWQGIQIHGGHYDAGSDPSADGFTIEFTPPAGTNHAEIHFRECELVGVRMQTPPLLRNCYKVRLNGSVLTSLVGNIANLVSSDAIVVDLMGDRDNNGVSSTDSTYVRLHRARPTAIALPTVVFGTGATGALASLVCTEIDYDGRGYVTWRATFDYVATSTGPAIFTLTLPAGVTLVDLESNSTTSAGDANPASVNLQLSTPRIFIPQVSGQTTNNALIVKARLNGT